MTDAFEQTKISTQLHNKSKPGLEIIFYTDLFLREKIKLSKAIHWFLEASDALQNDPIEDKIIPK